VIYSYASNTRKATCNAGPTAAALPKSDFLCTPWSLHPPGRPERL